MSLSTFMRQGFALAVAVVALLTFSAVARADTATLSTSSSEFTLNVKNQGWWSPIRIATNTDDNYITGIAFGGDHRSFFTFDLSQLSCSAGSTLHVRTATLKLNHVSSTGSAVHQLAIHDVSTPTATLNNNEGTSQPIYDDLGTGVLYGSASIANGATGVQSIPLNAAAVAAINAALGGFFSVGGSLTNLVGTGDDYIFGKSVHVANALALDYDCIPNACSAMTFTKVIYVDKPAAVITDPGVLLVFGRPNLPNNIGVPWASQVCLVGGSKNDTLSTGRGDDVIIGKGSTTTRDSINAFGGNDSCYDPAGTVLLNCEHTYSAP